ncbi:MAG: hypothetical protein E3J71_09720 [Candidatus Stahlbacteria bacterium]|nr:MAG: hypothetical protein E3J71_09720 [Candidatus Stahlbacteria bacterium]
MNLSQQQKKMLKKGVERANELFKKGQFKVFKNWRNHEKTLDQIKKEHGSFKDACADLNKWYRTRVNCDFWSERLEAFMREKKGLPQQSWVKEAIEYAGEKNRRSFLSKFFHFFVAPEVFPIYDKFAKAAVVRILKEKVKDAISYTDFCRKIDEISEALGNKYSYRELDHFFWMAGYYWPQLYAKDWQEVFNDSDFAALKEILDEWLKL